MLKEPRHGADLEGVSTNRTHRSEQRPSARRLIPRRCPLRPRHPQATLTRPASSAARRHRSLRRAARVAGAAAAGERRARPAATALVRGRARSLSYGELWERAARVAGGLRAAGVGRGDRVAIRLPNGIDWVLAFFGAQLPGAVVVPVNTRFTEDEVAYVVEDSGACTFDAGAALPDGEPLRRRGPAPGGPRGDLLHERHDRLSQGRDDLARQLPDEQRERVPLPEHRSRRRAVDLDARVGAAVPRHRLQQPADPDARARRPRGDPLQPAGPRRLLRGGRRARRQPARVGAGDLPRGDAPPAVSPSSTSAACAGSPTAARRSPRASCSEIKDAFPNARVATASA